MNSVVIQKEPKKKKKDSPSRLGKIAASCCLRPGLPPMSRCCRASEAAGMSEHGKSSHVSNKKDACLSQRLGTGCARAWLDKVPGQDCRLTVTNRLSLSLQPGVLPRRRCCLSCWAACLSMYRPQRLPGSERLDISE